MSEPRKSSPIEDPSLRTANAIQQLGNIAALQHFRIGKICAIPVARQVKPVPETAGFCLPSPVSFTLPL
jgi:hypothetical protein